MRADVLTYEINKHATPIVHISKYKTHNKPKVVIGSEDHRRHIHEKLLEHIFNVETYDCGNSFLAKGHKGKGIVIGHAERYEVAEWDGMKCLLIELWFPDDNSFGLFHPSDIKGPC